MGFSRDTRIGALVAAARHCCVCHRYKGVKVEVHHIIHRNQGGSDDYENAIALCFDCHTDAGHYNTNHPRGSSFSPAELIRHRDVWYDIVKANEIRSPPEPDLVYCRYLICQDANALKEISVGNFSHFPFGDAALTKNSILSFQRKLSRLQTLDYEPTTAWGRTYATQDEYWAEHPDARPVNQSTDEFAYFECTRQPTLHELKQYVSDRVAHFLMDIGVPASDIAQAFVSNEGCEDDVHDGPFQEVYRLRPLWATYLAVTNLTQEQISFTFLEGIHDHSPSSSFRNFESPLNLTTSDMRLPAAPLKSGSTVLIPVMTVLGPFDDFDFPELSVSRSEVPVTFPDAGDTQTQAILHTSFSKAAPRAYLLGPATWPSALRFRIYGLDHRQELHALDLSNLYIVDRYWEMGSCPYLFFRNLQTQRLLYFGELFSKRQGESQIESIFIPANVNEIIIAELEQEETFIEEIRTESISLAKAVQLSRDDILRLEVTPNTVVFITGYYVAKRNTIKKLVDPFRKNQLITYFLRTANSPSATNRNVP